MSAPAPAEGEGRPPSPRSPRPERAVAQDGPPTLPPGAFPPGSLPPGMMFGPAPPRPNIGSMLFLTAFFFFMSGGNNMPESAIVLGPDGEFHPRITELALVRGYVDEYRGWLNGTGNWTEPETPQVLSSSLIPPLYNHPPIRPFFNNITGFYKNGHVHPVDLLSSSPTPFFHGIDVPNLNTTSWNETLAQERVGEWDFSIVDDWSMNLKERAVTMANMTDWAWVKGGATLAAGEDRSIEYSFYGLHYIPNGTYNLFGLPDGMIIDIRNVPTMYPEHQNETGQIIMAELEKELAVQENNLLLSDAPRDTWTETTCPLLIYLTLPPLPVTTSAMLIAQYEQELHDPTGIRLSLPRPPNYWDGVGMGGVAVADGCGWAFGIESGTGVRLNEFWRKSVNYAAFASASQLLVLLLLIRQMESTRTPSTLAKVSVWTIVMMGISDSWVFSAHVVLGIVSDNQSSLPLLVPGFLCLCTAIIFAPRYAVLLHRIQAPERFRTQTIPAAPTVTGRTAGTGVANPTIGVTAPNEAASDGPSPWERFQAAIAENRGLRFAGGMLLTLIVFQLAFIPQVIPIFLLVVYSFWIPQIWRNARRGNAHSLEHPFVLGTTLGRLALPLYIYGCPDNVFFIGTSSWIWVVVTWQLFQVVVMFAQERFGPAFFLPKRFAPEESYNYHPLIPPPDPENPYKETERVCSICMEEVDIRPGPSGEVLLGINPRRAYALAPCHHIFHTKCLAQWLAIKTICPLCKRSLPPL